MKRWGGSDGFIMKPLADKLLNLALVVEFWAKNSLERCLCIMCLMATF